MVSEEGGLHSQELGNAAGVPLYVPQEGSQEIIKRKHSMDVLHDAGLNKARQSCSKQKKSPDADYVQCARLAQQWLT